jgi:DNA-binding IclR family transcriptional regulator
MYEIEHLRIVPVAQPFRPLPQEAPLPTATLTAAQPANWAGYERYRPVATNGGVHTSVDKALAVLEAFRGPGQVLGVTDIARRIQLPKSTTHRLLTVLHDRGYIERRGSRYTLGAVLFELGTLVPKCGLRGFRSDALPYLMELYRSTNATVLLAVLAGTDVLYVEKVHGRQEAPVPIQIGSRDPALTSALGLAILAHSAPQVVTSVVRDSARSEEEVQGDLDTVRSKLAAVRTAGVALQQGPMSGSVTIAAPVIDRGTDHSSAAVSVTVPAADPRRSPIIRELFHAVRGIAQVA